MDKKSPKVILLLQNSEPFLFGCQLIKSPKVILLLHNSEPLLSFTYCGYIEGTSKCEIFLLWAQLRQWLQTRHHKLWKQMDGTLPTVSITFQQQMPCNYWTCVFPKQLREVEHLFTSLQNRLLRHPIKNLVCSGNVTKFLTWRDPCMVTIFLHVWLISTLVICEM